jgi:hypothetical protein
MSDGGSSSRAALAHHYALEHLRHHASKCLPPLLPKAFIVGTEHPPLATISWTVRSPSTSLSRFLSHPSPLKVLLQHLTGAIDFCVVTGRSALTMMIGAFVDQSKGRKTNRSIHDIQIGRGRVLDLQGVCSFFFSLTLCDIR